MTISYTKPEEDDLQQKAAATPDPAKIQEKWTRTLKSLDAWWEHSGDPAEPYVLLTKGNISSLYANCAKLTSRPHILAEAVADLLSLAPQELLAAPNVVIGSAYGANTLAYEIARQLTCDAWFTAKGKNGEMELDRFEFNMRLRTAVLAEDVVTTFGTTRESIKGIEAKGGTCQKKDLTRKTNPASGLILPYVFCLVNRSGQPTHDRFKIISLINVNGPMWKEGQNPHTPDGKELLPPVRPKQIWGSLIHH